MLAVLTDVGICHDQVRKWKEVHNFILTFGDGKEEALFRELGLYLQETALSIDALETQESQESQAQT